MIYSSFDELIKKAQSQKILKKVAVVAAHDEHTLEAVMRAVDDNIVEPILIGREDEIRGIINKLGKEIKAENIFNVEDESTAAYKAVELVRAGKVDFLMKGKIQTADLLKAVVDKEKGLRTGSVMSHIAINEVPTYHKLIAITDGGMMMYPDLAKKKQIVENAVNTFLAMGYEKPKVAVLAAVERVNPKMPETVDANELKKMSETGEIPNCIIEGPISYDITMNKESAKIKGFESPVVEDADILVVPDIASGNMLSKALIYSAGAKMAGFIVGAKVPIVLTSRGSSSEEKYLSLVLSANIDS